MFKTEAEFLKAYDMNKFERPTGYTSDIVIFTLLTNEIDRTKRDLHVLLVKRKDHPGKGKWALPGGFVEHGEDALTGAYRELEEETGVEDVYLKHFGVYDAYGRDPRGNQWVITNAHYAIVHERYLERRVAGSDAEEIRLIPVSELGNIQFAFGDHSKIIDDALACVKKDMRETTVAKEFLDVEFAAMDLLNVLKMFEVFEADFPVSNFYSRLKKMKFVEPVMVNGVHKRGRDHSKRLAKLYRFNDEDQVASIY